MSEFNTVLGIALLVLAGIGLITLPLRKGR